MKKTIVKPLTYGRLGNFLFQVATAIGYSRKHGIEFSVPTETNNEKWNPIYFPHLQNPNWKPTQTAITIVEAGHEFQEIRWMEDWRGKYNVVLDGYWQSEKYFKEYRQAVLNEFRLPWTPMKGFVSVHVRRGDYLRLTNKHPYIGSGWIADAMAQFPGYHFIFFSDDIPWCEKSFGHRSDVSFSKDRDELTDLTEMSYCEHHICSASTFSWWGAWLNQNPDKRIVMPKLWFVPGHNGLNTDDIVPAEWERM